MAKEPEPHHLRERDDQSEQVVNLITAAAVGAPTRSIAYFLGYGLAVSLNEGKSHPEAVHTALMWLLDNKVPQRRGDFPVPLFYDPATQPSLAPIQGEIDQVRTYLADNGVRGDAFISPFYNLPDTEVGALVSHESGRYRTLVFPNPNARRGSNPLVSFSLVSLPDGKRIARPGVLPYNRTRGTTAISLILQNDIAPRRKR